MQNVRFHQENAISMAVPVAQHNHPAAHVQQAPISAPRTPIMDREIANWIVIVAHILLAVALCVVVPTVCKSFHVVGYDKVAFKRNVYGSVDTSRVYTNGRYFLPLTQNFVEFDNTLEPIAFLSASLGIPDDTVVNPPLSVALSNGVQIRFELLFQYRVDKSRLDILYTKYSTSYLSQIIAISTAAIKSAVIGFSQNDYLNNRALVERKLADTVYNTLNEQLYVFAPKDKFKLLSVTFPDSVVNTNLQAVLSVQRNEVAMLQQQVVAIESETQRQVAEITADQNQVLAQAKIDAARTVSFAQNQASNVQVGARAMGQAMFFHTIGVTNQTARLELIRILDILDSIGNVTVLQTTNTPLILHA